MRRNTSNITSILQQYCCGAPECSDSFSGSLYFLSWVRVLEGFVDDETSSHPCLRVVVTGCLTLVDVKTGVKKED